MNATKVSNEEHEVTMKLDGQVQPLPCKVAADKMSQVRKDALRIKFVHWGCFVTFKSGVNPVF